jgi:predicted dehydrogenase
MQFKVAIIGAGDRGRALAGEWQKRDDAAVVSVYDPDEQRCRDLAAAMGARPCGSHREAIAQDGVNAVTVATPVCFHAEVCIHALEHGCHVLCEKPLALTLAEAKAVNAAAEKSGRHLTICFQNRDTPQNVLIRTLVRENVLGSPVFAHFTDVREVRPKLAMHRTSMNGGSLIDMAGHWFDLMRFWTGAEAASVYAVGCVFGEGKPRLAGIDDLAVDTGQLTVAFDNGHVLSAYLCWGMPEGFPGSGAMDLCGPSGRLVPDGPGVLVQMGDRDVRYRPESLPIQGPAARVEDLVRAARSATPPKITGEDGTRALRISLAALESIETGRVVEL